jgi:predicted pyridoxine 5'-phosphate oxidase superfamily flavin-nucleotide-binding protein
MIGSEGELRDKFGEIHPLALAKTRPALDRHSRQFIAMSPFVVISTADANGKADLSPRGDPPGFVHVVDDTTILIPDRPGNNFIPGFEDTLRLNGRARITDEEALLAHCTVNGKAPKVGILIKVEEVFMHCAKALKRSKLWGPDYRQDRSQMPSIARIILEQSCEAGVTEQDAQAADESVEGDYRTGLY